MRQVHPAVFAVALLMGSIFSGCGDLPNSPEAGETRGQRASKSSPQEHIAVPALDEETDSTFNSPHESSVIIIDASEDASFEEIAAFYDIEFDRSVGTSFGRFVVSDSRDLESFATEIIADGWGDSAEASTLFYLDEDIILGFF